MKLGGINAGYHSGPRNTSVYNARVKFKNHLNPSHALTH